MNGLPLFKLPNRMVFTFVGLVELIDKPRQHSLSVLKGLIGIPVLGLQHKQLFHLYFFHHALVPTVFVLLLLCTALIDFIALVLCKFVGKHESLLLLHLGRVVVHVAPRLPFL